jgi:beta-galactosidase
MGANAYRCAHNQNSPVVYEACDRLGILVMDEFRHFDDGYTMKVTKNASLDNMDDQINQVKRNRNHPSIILWSVCNEEGVVQNTPLGAGLAAVLRNMINLYDGTRLTTAAVNDQFSDRGICAAVDVVGFNYMSYEYDKGHARFPKKSCLGTEASAEMATRGIYDRTRIPKGGAGAGPDVFGDIKRGWLSAYSENRCGWGEVSESAWKKVVARPWMSGYFVWTGFDYKGEPTPFSQPKQPSISSQFGILDTCGFPKDVYWYYKSWWTSEPVIHLFPHWNWQGREGETINVWVHSNCETVELFLNGKSLGKKTMKPDSHLAWDVAYTPGKLEAKGITKDGKTITDVVETTGAPAGLALAPDRTELTPDGQDLAWVGVSVLDDKGRVVPTANNMIRFSVTGPGQILGVGNGDPSCHEPDKASQRSAFNGTCMVLVQTTRETGRITLTAEGDGLKPTVVTFDVK